ncbi:MAG TPA: hypothetical protein DCO72_05800 [Ruminococcus sp.]|nr:hypothetical protein [Ruminococcus sp.]
MGKIEEVYAYLNENEPEIASNICYASEMLLSELDRALEVLKTRRKQAVENDDDKEYEKLTRYRDILGVYKENINTYLDYVNLPETSKTTAPSPDREIIHHLSEDFTYKKITAFVFRGKRYEVTSWKEALITFCNELTKINRNFPFALIGNPQFRGKEFEYFSYTPIAERSEKIQGTNVYVYTLMSSNYITKLLKNILSFLGESLNEFHIYLDETYLPQKREMPKRTEKAKVPPNGKIGKYVQQCMRELEKEQHVFSENQIQLLSDAEYSKLIFGIYHPFWTDDVKKIQDKNNRFRYWKEPFLFNNKYYYITNDWYEKSREKFDAWLEIIKNQ